MIEPYTLLTPDAQTRIPLIFDSPHSGLFFPNDIQRLVSDDELKTGWDAYIEDLWSHIVAEGGTLLHANFSRMFIDPNRSACDIDPELLQSPMDNMHPTQYSARGMGLIRRFVLPRKPMYQDKLSIDDVQSRICLFHAPYHRALLQQLTSFKQTFGASWHVDCHSMKSVGNKMNIDAGSKRPDIILGNNLDRTAGIEFTEVIRDSFEKLGYRVVLNDPYKGGYLVTHYGNLANNQHSIQIEINRALYMNEKRFEKNDNYEAFRQDLAQVGQTIADYVRHQVTAARASL